MQAVVKQQQHHLVACSPASWATHLHCAGVLSSRPTARDIKIDGFSLGICGNELIQDCSIELTIGRRYGLIGQNGCGKTSFLQVRRYACTAVG
jgi:ATP-binding cassette subfamily F protein 2